MRVPHPLRRLRNALRRSRARQPRPDEPVTLTRAQFVRFVRVNVAVGVAVALAAGVAAGAIAFGRIRVLEDDLDQRRARRVESDKQVAAILEQYKRTICTLARFVVDPTVPVIKRLREEFECPTG